MTENMNGFTPLEFNDGTLEEITRDIKTGEERGNLFGKSNVVGVGMGYKSVGGEETSEACMKVLVSQKLPTDLLSSEDMIPEKIEGTVTDVEEVGEIFAGNDVLGTAPMPTVEPTQLLQGNGSQVSTLEAEEAAILQEYNTAVEAGAGIQLLRNRVRPAEGGYSVGHYGITAGTIATAVYDARYMPGIPPRYYVLSNNHVLANSNNARVGDPILQPGPYDGGSYPRDMIARLSRWVPIRFGGPSNLVDAAIAQGPFNWLDREIYWIGYVQGARGNWPGIGEILKKTGRTTNFTTGQTVAVNATINVNYSGGRVARFVGQIVTKDMSAGGDSGSLVLDGNNNAIGLLFAGSSTHTIINHIYWVQRLLGIRVY